MVTPHRDVDAVEAALVSRAEERAVVDHRLGVFSTDGALAPLRQLHEVCRRHGALLIVDEAHGLGVRGTGGRGLLHEVGLAGAPDVVMTTTLSKALGSQGGVVLGPAAVRDAPDRRRAHRSSSTPVWRPRRSARRWAALRVLIAEPWRAEAVLTHAAALARFVRRAPKTPDSAVVSVILGDPEVALAAADGLPGRGVRVGLLPAADGPGGHVAAAADGAGLADRRRAGTGRSGARRKCSRLARVVTVLLSSPAPTPASARPSPPPPWPAMPGWPVSTSRCASRCRPASPGRDGDDDLAEVVRLSGVTELAPGWRYPEPLAPAAAAERAGLASSVAG